MSDLSQHRPSRLSRIAAAWPEARLWAEFTALYIGAPLAIALFLPPEQMFGALAAFTLAGLGLLWFTGGFDWRQALRGWSRIDWRLVGLVAAATTIAGLAVLVVAAPHAIFALPRYQPALLLMILALYPLLSALPQELIFRPLFFHRYGRLMPDARVAIWVNAGVFAFAHLMYWSLIVTLFTFVGGLIFARSYLQRGLPEVWVLHAVAGNILFAIGMGVYFYSGNVVRPF
ncbi:MAG: CPBP family glutamic-type intramembrane protease [Paracoccus sp. (in: a-proteobacteria)]|nr:CPBP family glutamic-type intramembrane protease [Paracoccus sp. (in: a-proteobacteria)]